MTNNTVISPVYPMLIQKYNTLIPDPNANVLEKINSIIDYLNQTGKLTNDVVDQWNKVMAWAMNDGLNTDVTNKINSMVADGTFSNLFNQYIAPSLGDITKLQTVDKSNLTNALNEVDQLAKSNQTNVGTLSSLTTTAKNNLVAAINENQGKIATNTSQLAEKVAIPTNLRIAMHYYFETDDSKLALFKSLGYNTIIIQRRDFLTDTTRTLAFLDKMFQNGISVMFYIDTTQLVTSGTPNDYTNWFTAFKDHNAVIAFGHYDEPFDQNIAVATTTAAYNTLKTFSDKPVFVIDPGNNDVNYNPDCFDIFMLDLYLTDNPTASYNSIQRKRYIYKKYVRMYKRAYLSKKRPKRFIPMFPLFAQTDGAGGYTWNMPTANLLKTMLDVYSSFGVTDYAVFGFDISWDSTFITLSNNTTLQRLSNFIRTSLYNTRQDVNYINPINFKMHKNYVTSTNMNYGSPYTNIYVPTGNASGNVIYRIQRENQATDIYYHINAHNQGGEATHTVNVSISYDGVTYQPPQTYSLAPTTGTIFPSDTDGTNVLSFPIDYNVAYVKFELVYNGTPGTDNAIGFQEIGCAAL